jgi:predicted AlkP superfamily phosphohydrolase/phosphomutase
VRDEIAARVAELRGPGGEPLVAQVHRREDLFQGPELDKVPDLLVEFDRYAWLGKGNLKSRSDSLWDRIEIEDSEHAYVGSHRHEGIAVLAGPAVAGGASLSGELVDIAPTLLYLLGEPIPSDLEGRVLFEALRPELLDERPPEYDDTPPEEFDREREELRDEGAAEVERRLRGLGYLE